jgi:hypothetical protein
LIEYVEKRTWSLFADAMLFSVGDPGLGRIIGKGVGTDLLLSFLRVCMARPPSAETLVVGVFARCGDAPVWLDDLMGDVQDIGGAAGRLSPLDRKVAAVLGVGLDG